MNEVIHDELTNKMMGDGRWIERERDQERSTESERDLCNNRGSDQEREVLSDARMLKMKEM